VVRTTSSCGHLSSFCQAEQLTLRGAYFERAVRRIGWKFSNGRNLLHQCQSEGSRRAEGASTKHHSFTKEQFVKTVGLAALGALSMGSSQVLAAELGVGVSVQSDDSIIYVPIDVNKSFRIEPSIRYLKNETDIGLGVDLESETLELAVGLFGLSEVSESIRIYYGGRLAYLDQESDQTIFAGVIGGNIILTSVDSDGYRISPTLGFEYMINDRFSIGGEAEYFFQDIDRDGAGDSETSGTDTRLIVRFRF
jgi:hypothetical protein